MKNEELDAEILDAIQNGRGRVTFSRIMNRVYKHQIGLGHPIFHRQWRLVDRRLQALRKRGRRNVGGPTRKGTPPLVARVGPTEPLAQEGIPGTKCASGSLNNDPTIRSTSGPSSDSRASSS